MSETVTTQSIECESCYCNFLAFSNSWEYKLKICYRCYLNGMAKTYLEGEGKQNVWEDWVKDKREQFKKH